MINFLDKNTTGGRTRPPFFLDFLRFSGYKYINQSTFTMNLKLFFFASLLAIFCACSTSKEVVQEEIHNTQTRIIDSAKVREWNNRYNALSERVTELHQMHPYTLEGYDASDDPGVLFKLYDSTLNHECWIIKGEMVSPGFMFLDQSLNWHHYSIYIREDECRLLVEDSTSTPRSSLQEELIIEKCYISFEQQIMELEQKLFEE